MIFKRNEEYVPSIVNEMLEDIRTYKGNPKTVVAQGRRWYTVESIVYTKEGKEYAVAIEDQGDWRTCNFYVDGDLMHSVEFLRGNWKECNEVFTNAFTWLRIKEKENELSNYTKSS